jgi:hypothetical protein
VESQRRSIVNNQQIEEDVMKRKNLNYPAVLALFTLSILFFAPLSTLASGDGAWTTTVSPGYIFLTEEGILNNEKCLAMTVIEPGYKGGEVYFGSQIVGYKYMLTPLNNETTDMTITLALTSVTGATVTVESCTVNCLWQPGQVVTLNKFYGDMSAIRLPKTGQTTIYNNYDDGYYQMGVAAPGSRFTDNSNGTVTDHQTGLIWLKEGNCFGEKIWYDALSACQNLASGSCGLSDGSNAGDWRLPNWNELKSIVDYRSYYPSINTEYFPNTVSAIYWSSTTYALNMYAALNVDFYYGFAYYSHKSASHYVRAVRGGK